jgi:hypothetical protein
MRGGVTRTSGTFPSVVTTLPAGYRPDGQAWFPAVVSGGLSLIGISASGDVVAYGPTAGSGASTNALLALDGVHLPVS